MRTSGRHLAVAILAAATAPAAARTPRAEAAGTYAQQLVRETMARHPELRGLEIALVTAEGCRTVAATSPEDIGEKCDRDEKGPMRTGDPVVEPPTKRDPVYDITQALHDASGTLIGAVGMDLAPQAGEGPAEMLERARAIGRELEPRIPSKERLLARAPGG